MTYAAAQHATKKGQRRKQIERAVTQMQPLYAKCQTDADKAAVLDVLMARIAEIQEGIA